MNVKEMSDEALVLLAKEENKQAYEEIHKRYDGAIKKIVRKYIYCGNDDLYQVGSLGVYSAVKNFDGVSKFEGFAYTCINNAIRSELRKLNSKKNEPLIGYIPLTGYGDGDSDKMEILIDSGLTPEGVCLDKENKFEIEVCIKESLSKLEYKILALFLQDYSYNEIAIKINKTEKAVDNAIQRIRKKLRQKLGR
jgi:RNA polymerase sporulation-specific sigma factor